MSLKKQLTILPDLSRVLPNLLRCPRELRAVRIRDPRSARCQCPCRWMRMTSISASKIMHWSVRSTFRRGRSEVPIGLLLRCTVSCARLMIESLGSAKLTFGPGAGLGLAFSTMTARTGPGANRCHLNRINRQSQNSDTHWLKVVRFIITSYHNSMTMTLKELKPHCYVQHCIHITQKNNRYCLKFHWSWNTHVNSQVTLQDWGPNQVVLSWTQTTTVAQEYKAILVGHSGPNWHQS